MKRHNFETAYIKLLVYGASGVGKTRLCGTFDQDERTARATRSHCGTMIHRR